MPGRSIAWMQQKMKSHGFRPATGNGAAAMIRLRQKCQDNLQADHFVSEFLAGVFCVTLVSICLLIGLSSVLFR